MDTREMRDRIKQKAAERVAIKKVPEYIVHKRRVRSYKSLIINLTALVGLFALVFVLQHVGSRHSDNPEPAQPKAQATEVTAAKITVEEPTRTIPTPKSSRAKIKNQQVAMVEMETTEEGAPQPKAQAKIILKTKKTEEAETAVKPRKTTPSRAYSVQSYREDRLRSAALVDMLDGQHSRQYSNNAPRTYTAASQRPTYATARSSDSGRADRRSSAELVDMLDGRGSQPTTQRSSRFDWANEVPMASTQTSGGIEETTLVSQTGTRTYAVAAPQKRPTYVTPSRRPAWDVNVGEHSN